MVKLKKYMMVHSNPGIDCNEVEENWRKLAQVEAGKWVKTYFNEQKGIRYCLWLAPCEEDLKDIFTEIGISWDSIIPIEETVPDFWGTKWDVHIEEESTVDTLGNKL